MWARLQESCHRRASRYETKVFSKYGWEVRKAMSKTTRCMQLTRAADYAVRVMIHLAALPEHERVSLPALALASEAPASFLSKVLQILAHAELIESRRGTSGGFVICEKGRKATLRTVIEAIEGPICLNTCLTTGRSCPRKGWCPAHPVWREAQAAMVTVLERQTVNQLAGIEQLTDGAAGTMKLGMTGPVLTLLTTP